MGGNWSHDAEGRVFNYSSSSASATYTSDGLGQRVQRIVNGTTYDYVFDHQGHENTKAAGGFAASAWSELYLGGMHVNTYANGSTYFSHSDHLGSERTETDPTGNTNGSYETNLPFGEWTGSGFESEKGFTGDLLDNADGYVFHTPFRQYTQAQGRWMVPDPAGLAAVNPWNPQTWNRYAYVGNSPVSYNDPSGLKRLPPGPNPGPGMYVGGYNFGCETQSECDFFNPFSYYAAYYLSQFSQAAGANVMMNGVGGFLCGEAEIPDDIPCGFPGGASIGDILGIPHPSGCEFGSCGPSIGSPFHTEPDGTVVGDFPGEVLCPPGWPCTAWNPDLQEWGAYDPSSCLSSASSDRFWCRAIWGSAYAIPAGLVDFGCLDVGGPAAEIWCNNVAQGALGAPVLLGLHGCSTNYAGAVNRCYNPQTGTGH